MIRLSPENLEKWGFLKRYKKIEKDVLFSQRDNDYCNAGHLFTTQYDSGPLRTFVLGGFLHYL